VRNFKKTVGEDILVRPFSSGIGGIDQQIKLPESNCPPPQKEPILLDLQTQK